ncbi:MAG: hypothetical protein ACI89X_005017 [Planctomycetota bacterium]
MTPTDGAQATHSASGRLPEALIIGAAKSATTSLFFRLIRHPGVFGGAGQGEEGASVTRSKDKEVCFFSDDRNYEKGLEWYSDHFTKAQPDQLCIEASTNYTRWPQLPATPERIAEHIPNARLIYIIRHPIERAYSHYVHRYTRELHPGKPILATFEEHILADPMCIDSSLYMKQIERYLEHFPRSALHVILTSDLKRDPEGTLRGVCEFLDLDPSGLQLGEQSAREANDASVLIASKTRGAITGPLARLPVIGPLARRLPKSWKDRAYALLAKTKYGRSTTQSFTPPAMTPEVRAKYLRFFERPNAELAKFLGRDLSEWSV